MISIPGRPLWGFISYSPPCLSPRLPHPLIKHRPADSAHPGCLCCRNPLLHPPFTDLPKVLWHGLGRSAELNAFLPGFCYSCLLAEPADLTAVAQIMGRYIIQQGIDQIRHQQTRLVLSYSCVKRRYIQYHHIHLLLLCQNPPLLFHIRVSVSQDR